MRTLLVLPLFALLACSSNRPAHQVTRASASENTTARFIETISAKDFYKGNLHTHTSETDGDTPLSGVLKWYRSHGYSFVAITDHDKLTETPAGLETKEFITIPGVEATGLARVKGGQSLPVHVNALCVDKKLAGFRDHQPVADILRANINLSRESGAVTMVNHPNFFWAIKPDVLLSADGFELLEIASGHPLVNERGNSTAPSAEKMWDLYMTKVHRIFGVAVDDSHHFKDFKADNANPGRGWVQVWAPELTKDAICNALRNGHFYSAKGAEIRALSVSQAHMEVSVANWQPSTDYVEFIGARGELLNRVTTNPAVYTLRGGEGYVRARVVQGAKKNKRHAWTQAYFISYDE